MGCGGCRRGASVLTGGPGTERLLRGRGSPPGGGSAPEAAGASTGCTGTSSVKQSLGGEAESEENNKT